MNIHANNMEIVRKNLIYVRTYVGRHAEWQLKGEGYKSKPFVFEGNNYFQGYMRDAILEATTRETGSVVFRFEHQKIELQLGEMPTLNRNWVLTLDHWIKVHQVDGIDPPGRNRTKSLTLDVLSGVLKITMTDIA